MKKFLSVVLVVLMVFSSFSLSAGAFGTDFLYEIAYGETITVEIPDSRLISFAMVQFIPEESGCFALTSSSDKDLDDPYCVLFDGQNISVLDENDDYNGYDFCLKSEFEAGKLYYFVIYNFTGAAEFEITLGCAHNYVDGFCEKCSEECPHIPFEEFFCYCECGNVFSGTDISVGETVFYRYDESSICGDVLRFIPEADGAYVFSSSSDGEDTDPAAGLFDEEFGYLTSADDSDGLDFKLVYNFEAGKEYFVFLNDYSEENYGFSVTLEKAEHKTDSGEIHPLVHIPEIWPTCTEAGVTEGLYCEECEEYISGHAELPMESHWDYNTDGYCEMCGGEVPLPDCSHICHSRHPILSFIWKMINIINRLFGINSFCECGSYHFV